MLTDEQARKRDVELGDEIEFFILDTQCSKCGHLYAFVEYHPSSRCTLCGNVDRYDAVTYGYPTASGCLVTHA